MAVEESVLAAAVEDSQAVAFVLAADSQGQFLPAGEGESSSYLCPCRLAVERAQAPASSRAKTVWAILQ